MKSFVNHFNGISITLKELFKGNFLLYFIPGVVITLIYWFFKSKTQVLEDSIDISTGYSWIDWATSWVDTGISQAFSLIGFIFEQIYIFVIITVLSPFNTSLGEKFDSKLTGNKFDTNVIRFINDFLRMIFIVIIAVVLEITFIIMYWFLSWMFGLDALDPFMYHIIAAFFFGFSFYDFSLERYEQGVGSSMYYAFEKPLTMILTGTIFLLMFKIPLVGIPLAPVLTIMISTVVYLFDQKKLANDNNLKKIENE